MLTYNALGRYGRLGNAMFQIASTIGIATKKGYEYSFPHWMNHDAKERFQSVEDIHVYRFFENRLPLYDQDLPILPDHFVHFGFHGFDIPDNVSLSGHMQSELYFEHCADIVRHYFKMKAEYSPINYTAVHVRCGDYGSDYHPICTKEYYQAAREKVKGPYMLFSDDPAKALEIFGHECKVFEGDTMDTLKMMKACKAHIIANSTFSWWGAWLSGSSEVVAPARWFGDAAQGLDASHIIPVRWTKI